MTGSKRNSSLAERLKAARERSGLTQLQVCNAINRSRGAVAQHESSSPRVRSVPDSELVMAYARLYKLPPEMLVDDSVKVADILNYDPGRYLAGKMNALGASARETVKREGPGGRESLFWASVQATVLKARPDLAPSFDVLVEREGVTARVPFLRGKCAVVFAAMNGASKSDFIKREVPPVLFLEKVVGRKCHKLIFALADQGTRGRDGVEDAAPAFDCTIHHFSKSDTAARALLSL